MHPHEIEEIETRFGPRMWDATPGVCCAYFQTGACSHTEANGWEYELENMPAGEPVDPHGDDCTCSEHRCSGCGYNLRTGCNCPF